jgi:endonuclease III
MEGRSMPATTNKQQLLNSVFNLLKKKYGEPEEMPKMTILEQLLFAICREDATPELANKAWAKLKDPNNFVDWNEARVSTVHEVSDALRCLSHPGDRARRIISVLQDWFEMTYSFDMEEIAKKGLKEGGKKVARIKGVEDFGVAWVTQHGLAGHAIPLDDSTLRLMIRLGVLDEGAEKDEATRGTVEHFVPKARGTQFVELITLASQEYCLEVPRCPNCPLLPECPTGLENTRSGNTTSEGKPRKSR